MKRIFVLRTIFPLATLLSALLAGETIDRIVVQAPAWRHLNIQMWALYSRHADLGNGAFVYPTEAIGSALLLIWTSIIIMKERVILNLIALPVYLAAAIGLAGLLFTFFAAPWMLSLRTSGDDPAVLQTAFDHFLFWSNLPCRRSDTMFPLLIMGANSHI